MNFRGIKRFLVTAVALVFLVLSLASCNRGIGCPSDFSIEQVAAPIVKLVQHR